MATVGYIMYICKIYNVAEKKSAGFALLGSKDGVFSFGQLAPENIGSASATAEIRCVLRK